MTGSLEKDQSGRAPLSDKGIAGAGRWCVYFVIGMICIVDISNLIN